MEFAPKKLPPQAVATLRNCPIATVQPFAIMLAPVYVYMKRNEKFVSVKAPLDFFAPQELERLKPFGSFFLTEFVDRALPFHEAARRVYALLAWRPKGPDPDPADPLSFPEVPLPPAPYELSDAVLRVMGPLWVSPADTMGGMIEPFFAAVFANELCRALPEDVLRRAHDTDVEKYELAVLRSGWAVFLALHLGYCEQGFLSHFRQCVFEETASGAPAGLARDEPDELAAFVRKTLPHPKVAILSEAAFARSPSRVAQKLVSRLARVKSLFITRNVPVPSIRGPGGFQDEVAVAAEAASESASGSGGADV